ncbi:ribosome maturation factor RimM [Actinotalea sp. K2]|uniref:ribosome maturation factor RimM n=1 Tax=Actinotalea sp. K2 TaxID=2939438 RepID=UPI0020174D51|nr:ribosome maturation factor RimM [Actinotalea sp. K2]MCL3860243.1 ribosome maturation factor RimM [Actinotalea sp. K2]
MQLTVARIGRAHGLRGEVALEVRTDVPRDRFVVGVVLTTDPPTAGPLTVARVRDQNGRWLVTFEEARDRTQAEALRGVDLVVEVESSDEEDAWYPYELAGLRAERPDGTPLGEVVGLEHLPAQDALVLREHGGERTLVPFVRAIVPVVDVPGGRVVIDAPHGLLAADGLVDDEPESVLDDLPGDEPVPPAPSAGDEV